MAIPSVVQPVIASWSSYYGGHPLVSVTVRYLHLSSILIGGGTAVALDLAPRRSFGLRLDLLKSSGAFVDERLNDTAQIDRLVAGLKKLLSEGH